MSIKSIYTLLDTETNEQFTGTCCDVARILKINPGYVHNTANLNRLYKHRYRISKEEIETGKPIYKNMSKALKQLDQLHNWYVEFRTRHPKEIESNG